MSEQAERVYERARSLPPGERAAFVEDTYRADPRVADELVSLLEQAEAAEAFFQLLSGAVFSQSALMSVVGDTAQFVDAGVSPIDGVSRSLGFAPGDTITHYRILSRIGSGGMGTVYRAHDTRLDRAVALKFLSRDALAPPDGEERLVVEARAAAALEHPNVCVIHDIGETDDGRPFIAMAFYEGETLKERVKRGPLPVDEAATIAVQIARGLAAAHARGIIHRDVKPGNVMISADGMVKVLDFGLAKVDDVTVSRPGMTPGTVAYMSPEQVRGDPINRRTDLWSLGVVLYEMLTGTRPFRGGGEQAVLQAILHEDAAPLSTRRPETPERLSQIVTRLLRKDRDERYASASELLADLSRAVRSEARAPRLTPPTKRQPALLIGSVLGLVALAAAALWLVGRGEESVPTITAAPAAVRRVLVADFASVASDSLLSDAASQAIRVDLARSPGLRVAGAASVTEALQRMRRDPTTRLTSALAREVALREGIPAVIQGDVRRVGTGYVVSAAIVEASTGEVVGGWREAARDSTALIDAIDRLSATIRSHLGESLASLEAEQPLGRFTTTSLEALRRNVQAMRVFLRGDYLHAAALFEEAIRLDSTFARAYFGLSHSLDNAGGSRSRTLEATVRAYELRDNLSALERHAVTANYYWRVLGDLPKAIEAYRNQIAAAKPARGGTDDAEIGFALILYGALGNVLTAAGDLEGAEAVGREARVVFPTALNQASLVRALYGRGKAAEAVAILQEAMGRNPGHPALSAMQAEMAAASGDYDRADALVREPSFGGGFEHAHRIEALSVAVRGRVGDAIRHFRAMRQEQSAGGRGADAAQVTAAIGRLYLVRGQPDAAVSEVEGWLASSPLDSLHVLDRPYLTLARLYADAGQPRRAGQLLAAYQRGVPQQFRKVDRWLFLRARAAISLADGVPRAALADLEQASREPAIGHRVFDDGVIRIDERPELARAYDRAGHADSAIATYERYVAARSLERTRVDAFELPNALFRLAELYQARGDRAAAARHYLRFAELWKGADPELQSRVREARRRAAELTAPREGARGAVMASSLPLSVPLRHQAGEQGGRGTRAAPH